MENYICQSCSMPMQKESEFGTNADNTKNKTYCCYCFKNGNFINPNLTKEDMINKVADFIIKEQNMSKQDIIKKITKIINNLKRWKN